MFLYRFFNVSSPDLFSSNEKPPTYYSVMTPLVWKGLVLGVPSVLGPLQLSFRESDLTPSRTELVEDNEGRR